MLANIFKFLHLFFLFIWLGNLLTLTRLLGSIKSAIFQRIYCFVEFPAMILALATGLALFCCKDVDVLAPWFHLKMTCAVLLVATDIVLGCNIKKERFKFKILHYSALVLLILILFSVYILKYLP